MATKVIKPPKKCAFITKKNHNRQTICAKSICRHGLAVGKNNDSVFRSLLKFDLSSLPPFLTIINGTLNLKLTKNQFPLLPKTIAIHKIVSAWTEKSVCRGHLPLIDPAPISAVTLTKQQFILVSWGLSPLIQNWYSGLEANLGIMLKMANECYNNCMVFADKNCNNSTFWPYLEIDFLDQKNDTCNSCCQPIEVAFKPFTGDTVQCTDPINTLMFNYSYFVINTGEAPADAFLQTSADGYHWGTNSAVTTINPGETRALVPDWIAKFSKVCYKSAAAGQSTSLEIYLQGRS